MKKGNEDRASWTLAVLLLIIVGAYIALNWEAVFPPLVKTLAEFFR
ncbi:MAG TPA: hypothetical protein VIL97_04705 [Thermoanaerobaculia bacterium]